VLITITAKTFGVAGVVNADGRLVGVITDGDLRRHMSPNLLEVRAEDIMTRNPISVPPHLLAAEALGLMNEKRISAVFVLEDGRPIGLVRIHDILHWGLT